VIEPTITFTDECSLLMLTVEGDGIVCPPGWEEIRTPWWRRALARLFGLPVVRVFVKGPARG
jgi:hypothetical protein